MKKNILIITILFSVFYLQNLSSAENNYKKVLILFDGEDTGINYGKEDARILFNILGHFRVKRDKG